MDDHHAQAVGLRGAKDLPGGGGAGVAVALAMPARTSRIASVERHPWDRHTYIRKRTPLQPLTTGAARAYSPVVDVPRARRRDWRRLALAVVVPLAAGCAVIAWWLFRAPADDAAVVYGTVPEFSLTERSGRTVTRADLLGQVWVADFFYTRCPDVCSLQTAHLARLQAELPARVDERFVSVTVDPDHDRPTVLSAYAARFHADPRRWLFLTGPRPAIERLAFDGFHLAVPLARRDGTRSPWAWIQPGRAWAHGGHEDADIHALPHAAKFALVDRQGRIRGYFDSTDWSDVERLREALTLLLRRKR